MNISNLSGSLPGADLPAEQIGALAHLSEAEKVGQLSQKFEALLLRQILQNARKTVIPSALGSETATSAIYQDMVNQQLAEGISQSGGFGLAETLQQQLTRQLSPTQAAPAAGG